MKLRTLKLRATMLALIRNLVSRLPKHKAHDFAWDDYVCDNIDPDEGYPTPQEYADYKAHLEAFNNETSAPDLYRRAGLM